EGTYPLPEAQQDRFLFKAVLDYPSPDHEMEMLARWDAGIELRDPERAGVVPVLDKAALEGVMVQMSRVHVEDVVRRYIVELAAAPRPAPGLGLGASPPARGLLLLAPQASA